MYYILYIQKHLNQNYLNQNYQVIKMTEPTQVIGFCILCRRKSVMNQLTTVNLPLTNALGRKGRCTYCNAIIFKLV